MFQDGLAGRFPLPAGRASRIPLVRKASDRSALRLLAKDHASILVPPPQTRANTFRRPTSGRSFAHRRPQRPTAAKVKRIWVSVLCRPRRATPPRVCLTSARRNFACVRLLGPCFKTGWPDGSLSPPAAIVGFPWSVQLGSSLGPFKTGQSLFREQRVFGLIFKVPEPQK